MKTTSLAGLFVCVVGLLSAGSVAVSDHLNLYFFEGSPDRILAR